LQGTPITYKLPSEGGLVSTHSEKQAFAIDETHLSLKYRAVIREIGPMVSEFFTHGILIFFGESAPQELREVSLIHNGTRVVSDLVVGDLLKFVPPPSVNQQPSWYRLTAVGSMANANLAELGHVVLHFDGASKARLPGAISVEPSLTIPLEVGTTFELFGREE
jgi:glucitol/sorbitol PTS system EIIA component